MNPVIFKYSLQELENRPTLRVGQYANLKVDNSKRRVWLSRMSVEDGEPFNNKVTVERLIEGRWIEVESYEAT
jgi:NAD(P)H-flavin reductase